MIGPGCLAYKRFIFLFMQSKESKQPASKLDRANNVEIYLEIEVDNSQLRYFTT